MSIQPSDPTPNPDPGSGRPPNPNDSPLPTREKIQKFRSELKSGMANVDQANFALYGILLMFASVVWLFSGDFLYALGGGALSAFLLYHNYPNPNGTSQIKELFLGLLRVVRAFAVVFAILLCLCVPVMLIAGQFAIAAIAAVIAAPILYYLYPRTKSKRPPA